MNTSTILTSIRKHGPISRADLVKTTHLSPTTVSVLVDALLKEGLIDEVGIGESTGGRRPILLTFQPTSRLALGIDISVQSVTIGLLDLKGTLIAHTAYTPDLESATTFLDGIITNTKNFLKDNTKYRSNILGIGIATPGLLNIQRTKIKYSSSLGLKNVPIYDAMCASFDLPIRVENDMNAAALGEKVMGAGANNPNMIYVSVGSGVGAGIIINDQIYPGATGSAGEFGHMVLDPNGPLCSCGNYGCLGALIAEPAMVSKAIRLSMMGVKTKINTITGGDRAKVDLDVIIAAASQGDSVAAAIIDDTIRYLGIGLGNLLNVFDPYLVVLGGKTMNKLKAGYSEQITEQVHKNILPLHETSHPDIVHSEFGIDAGIIGASTLIFGDLLEYVDILSAKNGA